MALNQKQAQYIKNRHCGFYFEIKEINEPIFQVRAFYDNTYSVMARIYLPEKYFFEHPELINLSYQEALDACSRHVNKPICVQEILEKWEFVGT